MTGSNDDWRDVCGFTEPKHITETICDKKWKFRPISVGMMAKMRCVAKPIAKAITNLMGGGNQDQGRIER